MTKARNVTDRVFIKLTERERVAAAIRAVQGGKSPARALWTTMPDSQREDAERDVGIYASAILYLTWHHERIDSALDALEDRWRLYKLAAGAHQDLAIVHHYVANGTCEPINESEYGRRLEAARNERVAARLLAQDLIESAHESEGAVDAGADRRANSSLAEREAELARLVEVGALVGEWDGGTLLIRVGSFHDWCGQPTRVWSSEGRDFQVFADSRSAAAENIGRLRDAVLELSRPEMADGDEGTIEQFISYGELARVTLRSLVREFERLFLDMKVCMIVMKQLQDAHFGGVAPSTPQARELASTNRRRANELYRAIRKLEPRHQLPVPSEAQTQALRRLMVPITGQMRAIVVNLARGATGTSSSKPAATTDNADA